MTSIALMAQTGDVLGECPVVHPAEGGVFWIDVERRLLRRLHSDDGTVDEWTLPEKIGSFGFRGAQLIVALESGLYEFSLSARSLRALATPEAGSGTRFNDGQCDPRGRFWAGTMHPTGAARMGSLYCLELDGQCRRALPGFGIPNGLAWSPDTRTMYIADSMDRAIYALDYDLATGAIGNRRVFADTSGLPGVPDGAAMDRQGYLWSAQCGGWRLVRYAPDGSVDRTVDLPVRYPTSCAFAEDGVSLYVTTAIWDIPPEERAMGQPLAGGLLRVDVS